MARKPNQPSHVVPSDLGHELTKGYAGRRLRFRAFQLAGTCGFSRSDRDDLEQELRIAVMTSIPKYKPERGPWNVFVFTVIERTILNYFKEKQVRQRMTEFEKDSLSTLMSLEDQEETYWSANLNLWASAICEETCPCSPFSNRSQDMGTDAKHVVRLTVAERVQLDGIVADSRAARGRVLRSRMLLKADAEGPAWPDSQIAEAFGVNAITVSRLRKRCVWEGLDAALVERPRSGHKPRKLDGAGEAQLIAIACGAAPEGRHKWTMQLLADKLVELEIVEEISDEAVRQTLKKTSLNLGCASSGSSRPITMPSSCATWKTS